MHHPGTLIRVQVEDFDLDFVTVKMSPNKRPRSNVLIKCCCLGIKVKLVRGIRIWSVERLITLLGLFMQRHGVVI